MRNSTLFREGSHLDSCLNATNLRFGALTRMRNFPAVKDTFGMQESLSKMTRLGKHRSVFLVLWATSLLIWRYPLFDTFSLSIANDEYTHILLILPVSAVLLFFRRESWWEAAEWNLRLASVVLLCAMGVTIYRMFTTGTLSSDTQLAFSMFALVLLWIGIFALCFGAKASKSVLFSLLFLFGLVPLPKNVLNCIIALLQLGSAWSAHVLFALFAVPVVQEGNFLTIPGLTVQVAAECSSIRSSSMLLVTTIVLVQVLLKSFWRKALVIGLAIPISVVKNGLRIFTIAMLGTRVDPAYLTGRLHHQGGIFFFAVALIGIFSLLWICRRAENTPWKSTLDTAKVEATRA